MPREGGTTKLLPSNRSVSKQAAFARQCRRPQFDLNLGRNERSIARKCRGTLRRMRSFRLKITRAAQQRRCNLPLNGRCS